MMRPNCCLCARAFFGPAKAVSSDKLAGSGLLLLSMVIFVYYTVWVIVLVGLFEALSTDLSEQRSWTRRLDVWRHAAVVLQAVTLREIYHTKTIGV